MNRIELYKLNSRLACLYQKATNIETEVCEVLNELAAERIPTMPELTEEAQYQLQGSAFYDLSGAIDALMEIVTEIANGKCA